MKNFKITTGRSEVIMIEARSRDAALRLLAKMGFKGLVLNIVALV